MPNEPWDNPDLDDYEFVQARMEGAGDWTASDETWWSDLTAEERVVHLPTRSHRLTLPPELTTPTERGKRFRVLETFKGDEYVRTETGWTLHGQPFTFMPITGRLEAQLRNRLETEDAAIDDPAHLVERAWLGQALEHFDRVVMLTTRALRAVTQPPDRWAGGQIVASAWQWEAAAAAAMLCSALRQLGDADQALEETDPYADMPYAPLMASRAAALCDIGRWEDAQALATAARRLSDSGAVRLVLGRIERHFSSQEAYAAD